jgi:hypothetical protein
MAFLFTFRGMITCLRFLSICIGLLPLSSRSQEKPNPEQVLNQVYEFLTQESIAVDSAHALIQLSAWEALAYLEDMKDPQPGDLSEAVPDYYNFKGNTMVIKLIDPETNEYGVELTTPFRISENRRVLLIDSNTGAVRDEWTIIGLDKNYLALDMGELKVFFTHTPAQE